MLGSTGTPFDGKTLDMGDSRSLRTLPSTRRLALVRLGAVEPGAADGARSLEVWLVEVAPAALAPAQAAPAEASGLRSNAAVPSRPQRVPDASLPAAPRDGVVRRALELMQNDLKRRWTVAALAKAVGVSRAVFARRFAAALGTSPIAHLTALRLARAAQRMTEVDAGMAELGAEVGDASEFAFSRAFKRAFGTFRRRQRLLLPAELESLADALQPEAPRAEPLHPETLRSERPLRHVPPRCLALAA